MIKLEEMFNPDLHRRMLDEGYIRSQRHNELPLTIYNYTEAATYDSKWNEVTLQCRGLIVADDGLVVARPFPKFFNLGETAVPQFVVTGQPAQIHEKLDGSLGILYHYDEEWHVATRGSFHSEQAEWATQYLRDAGFAWPHEHVTHLVEIIYPENRIVVNYGERQDLAFLATIDNRTGEDIYQTKMWPFGVARRFTDAEIQDITHRTNGPDHEGEEGVVMVWPKPGEPAFRLKIKRADYVEMHRIVTGMTARKVWQLAKDGVWIESVIQAGVPEEWADWVRDKYEELYQAHDVIVRDATKRFDMLMADPHLKKNNGTTIERAKFAKAAKRYEHPHLLFALLDGKSIDEKVWDMIYPPHEVPFGGE